jgi:pyrimidine deaminase RibD-like protein
MSNGKQHELDVAVMRAAIDAAKKSHAEDSRLHPRVGAALVKDDVLLATAHRGELGAGDHAEFTLLERKLASLDVSGSTLFTTLEPCTQRKRHRSCTDWIIDKGLAHVVVGMLDPNPRIYSQSVTQLRSRGIKVDFFPAELREEIVTDNADFISQYHANPALTGEATFNYSHNDGRYTIGHGERIFETRWSKASDTRIHLYRDGTNIRAIRLIVGAKGFGDLNGSDSYDGSSRVQTPAEGEFVLLENTGGYFAAIKVIDVCDRTRADSHDSVAISYRINTEKQTVFGT